MKGSPTENAVCQKRGLLLENNLHFNYAVKCSVHTGDSVVIHYSLGSNHVIIQTFIKDLSSKRYNLDCAISKLIYARNWKLYIGYTLDLHLKVYNQNFDSVQTIALTSTILSFAYNEVTSELYAGTIGCVGCWNLSYQVKEPLSPGTAMACNISKKEWVISLQMSAHSSHLVAGCQNGVYIIDWRSRTQVNYQPNFHTSSLTCAVLYSPSQFIIIGAKDGSIKVLSSILNRELCTSMRPMGHLQEITGLYIHPTLLFLISSSLDGNIRIWDLQSFEQYCSYHCASPIVACSLTLLEDIFCCSQSEINILRLNQVEKHLCSLHSKVESISTVRERSQAAFVTTEDGSARLLNTVSGQTITIMFPLYSILPTREVMCNLYDKQLYALLSSGEIMVFAANTNPSCAVQLWCPETDDECVTCMTMTQDKRHTLLVAGHQSGSLSILYNGGCSIPPQPYYAHGMSIIKITSSQEFKEFPEKIGATIVSFGEDDYLHVWMIYIEKELKSKCSLKRIMTISLSFYPTCMATTNSCLAIASPDSRVLAYHLPPSGTSTHYLSEEYYKPATNQSEDAHIKTITSLSIHQTLNLIATSGEDGKIKIWDIACELVAEVTMGSTVDALCFVTKGADILIGFHEQLCVINGTKLFPSRYLEGLNESPTKQERTLSFDPQLEFWYDEARVKTFSLWDPDRFISLLSFGSSVNSTHVFNDKSDLTQEESMVSNLITSTHDNNNDTIELSHSMPVFVPTPIHGAKSDQALDKSTVDALKHKSVEKDLSKIMEQQEPLELNYNQELNETIDEEPMPSPPAISYQISEPMIALYSKVFVKPLSHQPSPEHSTIAPDGFIPNSIVRQNFKPLVTLLPEPTIRAYYNVQQSIVTKILVKSNSSKKTDEEEEISQCEDRTTTTPTCISTQPSRQGARWNLDNFDKQNFNLPDNSWNVLGYKFGNVMTATDPSFPRYKGGYGEQRPNHGNYIEERKRAMANRTINNRVGKQINRGAHNESTKTDDDTLQGSSHHKSMEGDEEKDGILEKQSSTSTSTEDSSNDANKSAPLVRRKKSPTTLLSRRHANQAQDDSQSTSPVSKIGKIRTRSRSRNEAVSPEFGSNGERSFHSPTELGGDSSVMVGPSKKRISAYSLSSESSDGSLSSWLLDTDLQNEKNGNGTGKNGLVLINGKSQIKGRRISKISSLQKINQERLNQLLEEIVLSTWFPKSEIERPISLEFVTTELLDALKSVSSFFFGQVCNAVNDLNNLNCISSSFKLNSVPVIIERMESESSSDAVKAHCLNLIGQLDLKSPAALKAILPLLTNSNEQIRKIAFSTLKSLTGVSTRAELHKLLVDIGLLQETRTNEEQALIDLEQRLRSRLRSKSLSHISTTNTSLGSFSNDISDTSVASGPGLTTAMSTPYQGLSNFPFHTGKPRIPAPLPPQFKIPKQNINPRDIPHSSQTMSAQEKILNCYGGGSLNRVKNARVKIEALANKWEKVQNKLGIRPGMKSGLATHSQEMNGSRLNQGINDLQSYGIDGRLNQGSMNPMQNSGLEGANGGQGFGGLHGNKGMNGLSFGFDGKLHQGMNGPGVNGRLNQGINNGLQNFGFDGRLHGMQNFEVVDSRLHQGMAGWQDFGFQGNQRMNGSTFGFDGRANQGMNLGFDGRANQGMNLGFDGRANQGMNFGFDGRANQGMNFGFDGRANQGMNGLQSLIGFDGRANQGMNFGRANQGMNGSTFGFDGRANQGMNAMRMNGGLNEGINASGTEDKHSHFTNDQRSSTSNGQLLLNKAATKTDWEKYEWNNVQIMMHSMKQGDLFNQIIWQNKET